MADITPDNSFDQLYEEFKLADLVAAWKRHSIGYAYINPSANVVVLADVGGASGGSTASSYSNSLGSIITYKSSNPSKGTK